MRSIGRTCLPSLSNTVDGTGTALCLLTTKRIFHLEDRSTTYAIRHDQLESDQIPRLESIGFVWNPLDQQCEEMFSKLTEIALSHSATKMSPRLDYGSWHSETNVVSLILIEYLDSSPLDLSGMLMTANGRKCLPSSRNTTENKGIASFHDTTKRILHLVSGLWHSATDVMSFIPSELLDLIRLDFFGTLMTINGRICLPS